MSVRCECGHEFEPKIDYRHKLICGDCTDRAVVDKILENNIADLVITDPPYNYDFDYGVASDNLSIGEYEAFVRKWWSVARKNRKRMIVTPGLEESRFLLSQF